MTDRLSDINRLWTALHRRADRLPSRERVHETFVETDYFSPAAEAESTVMFGRRGAGKTHTLLELDHFVRSKGDIPVYVDMRRLGSNSGIYDNPEMPFATRASRMLIDLIEVVHENLVQLTISDSNESFDLSRLGPALDDLGEAATQIRVNGTVSVTHSTGFKIERTNSRNVTISAAPQKSDLGLGFSRTQDRVAENTVALKREGAEEIYIHLGSLEGAVERVCCALEGRSLWLLIDEWSEAVPYELQIFGHQQGIRGISGLSLEQIPPRQ